MYIVTSQQMRQAEEKAGAHGLSFSALMEEAGRKCAEIIINRFNITRLEPKNVLILCGRGKNGGDGFVAARHLWKAGARVTVLLVDGKPTDDLSKENFELLAPCSVDTGEYSGDVKSFLFMADKADIVVDAIYGTGFRGSLSPHIAAIAKAVLMLKKPVVSLDVPSGALCDSAGVSGAAFCANLTIAIAAYKSIHVMKPACRLCGETVVADIGITKEDFESIDSVLCFTLNDRDVSKLLPRRKINSNKGTYGNALLCCGSMKMPGAACIAAKGALRSGVGLVSLAFPTSAYNPISAKLSEPVFYPLESNLEGTFAFNAFGSMIDCSKKAGAALLGPGIGVNTDTIRLVNAFIKGIDIPMVLDADALNAIADKPDILKSASAPIIVTPHPGEMSRLTKKEIPEIMADPIGNAYAFAKKYNVTVVLKTANTIVCSPDKEIIYINRTGNPGLSKGGSGDLLAGIMVSLLAQGCDSFNAASLACYLHGKCAEKASETLSLMGMQPTDLTEILPVILKDYESVV